MIIHTEARFFDTKTIEGIEEKTGANFVFESALLLANSEWSRTIAAIFYNPLENAYFGIVSDHGKLKMIRNVQDTIDKPFFGVAHDGHVFYSVARNDKHKFDTIGYVEGGRDFFRTSVPSNKVVLQVIDGSVVMKKAAELEIVETVVEKPKKNVMAKKKAEKKIELPQEVENDLKGEIDE